MTTMHTAFTRDDYLRLPEGFPAELVDGFLVKEPSPFYGHQLLVLDVALALRGLLPRGAVLVAPVDVPIDDHNVYQPDVAAFAEPVPPEEGGTRVPSLVVEILSRRTRSRDRGRKRRGYLAAGVEEVWLVDPDARGIEFHDSEGLSSARGGEVLRSCVVGGFSLSPADLFATLDR